MEEFCVAEVGWKQSKSTHGEKKDFVIVGLSVCLWVAHGLLQLID